MHCTVLLYWTGLMLAMSVFVTICVFKGSKNLEVPKSMIIEEYSICAKGFVQKLGSLRRGTSQNSGLNNTCPWRQRECVIDVGCITDCVRLVGTRGD